MPQPIVDPAQLADAVQTLHAGGLVAFPTETVFGLGARLADKRAAARIFDLKRRPRSRALLAHISSVEMARPLVAHWPDRAGELARRFWPGPLTLVLPKSSAVPAVVTGDGPTIGLRCPDHPVALALIEALGEPIAATSANRHGRPPLTNPRDVQRAFPSDLVTILSTGKQPAGVPSTVLLLGETPAADRILRPGPISAADCGVLSINPESS